VVKRHHFDKVLEWAKKGRIAPLYLFAGNEEVGRTLKKRLLSLFRQLGLFEEEIDLAETDPQALLSSLKTPSLLGRKVINLRNDEKILALDAEELVEALKAHKQSVSLLLCLAEIGDDHPLCLLAREGGVLVTLSKRVSGDLLKHEIPEILASFGKKMDRATAELLVSLVGEDLSFLQQEIEKLALYVGDSPVIGPEDVRALVSPKPEEAPYTVLETLFSRGVEEALKASRELFLRGTHPLVLLATFFTFFKRLWLLRELLDFDPSLGETARKYPLFRERLAQAQKGLWGDRIPRNLKLHPYALFRMLAPARRFRAEDFPLIISSLARLDEALKSGARPEEAFYEFFLSLQSLLSPGGGGGRISSAAVRRGL